MADIEKALETNRTAVDELLQAAEATAGTWELPRAPGKWSPSQLIEHLALSYDESAKLVAGESSNFRLRRPSSARSYGVFGAVSLEDYVRFQAVHVRHHRKQILDA